VEVVSLFVDSLDLAICHLVPNGEIWLPVKTEPKTSVIAEEIFLNLGFRGCVLRCACREEVSSGAMVASSEGRQNLCKS
jgi:hypothetical protein